MGVHAAIIRLSTLIHEGESAIPDGVPAVTPPLKNPSYAPDMKFSEFYLPFNNSCEI